MSKRDGTRDRWRKLIEQQKASGLSVAAFCRQSGVSQPSFYAWRQKLRGEVAFTEVRLSPDSRLKDHAQHPGRQGGIELRLPGRRCVVVHPGFDRQTLLDLLDTLETGPSASSAREWDA